MSPARVTDTSSAACEMPKSTIFATPSSVIRMLPGLMSRCTIPAACAAASAPATCAPMFATTSGASGPCSASRSARLRAGRYSMTSTGKPWSVNTSCTATAFGCCSRAAIRPSRSARCRASSARRGSSPGWRSSRLMATGRRSSSSSACHTTPIAPLPSRCRSRYRPPRRSPVSLTRSGYGVTRAHQNGAFASRRTRRLSCAPRGQPASTFRSNRTRDPSRNRSNRIHPWESPTFRAHGSHFRKPTLGTAPGPRHH
ncbi:hypothetical protein B0I33_11133 [Prauserella shujinwangii]|uniref:Uncharacterized protein n=1 Tax=Prauserella shujinwangii TaxID=1453103 RepID=A0A2T0LMW6_9PSEU|nr:hypothetical protein B0I33_11133 [Prauserella shujinwangii]